MFALCKPTILADWSKSTNNYRGGGGGYRGGGGGGGGGGNKYYDSAAHTQTKKGVMNYKGGSGGGNWNNFAAKKLETTEKVFETLYRSPCLFASCAFAYFYKCIDS